ncbi:MAG TPA: integrase [Sporosarcina psychrophila]|uniref:Integrase n=1 Tax=Sporosarcina psychrophila TaxID=1476 RepID=A0A921KCA5_SPOPS|nr:integrase [Sporosarcina psychrophila]
MNKRNLNKRIKQSISATAKAVHMDTLLKHQHSGVNMSYNFIHNFVGFDVLRIKEARKSMQEPVSLETYIQTLTLHELGHAVDREALLDSLPRTIEIYLMKRKYTAFEYRRSINHFAMIIEEHVMNIEFEETAWRNAEMLNRFYGIVNWGDFEKVKAHSLATYKNLYENDLRLYQALTAEMSIQAAG